jgi:transcriptional regulator GlxA family with amidase domain
MAYTGVGSMTAREMPVNVAILTFEGFNEIDSFVSFHILNRVPGWKVAIACPAGTVQSTNGVRITAQQPLEFANDADAVLFGGSPRSREMAEDRGLMSRLKLDPRRQLIGSQCAGAFFLAKLGFLARIPVCTNSRSRPALEGVGIRVLDQSFVAAGNIATAGGCLASPYLATWTILRLAGRDAAEATLGSVAPVGERARYIADMLGAVAPFAEASTESAAVGV